jgi:4-hydroxyphenylpyruvate dioxygenase
LLQIFTKPLGDRPTVFIEVIQRVGCTRERQQASDVAAATIGSDGQRDLTDVIELRDGGVVVEQAAGCGGFGKGNFSELFKSIEDYERTLAGANTADCTA